ncbi:4-aminobutyrate aminotransferase-like enzyme [Novosphingobium sp. 1529]|uniref:aspartate aminotransferase family protein n=1 Tax=Novosphingobium sp. 1529 TaxID=3156424 RepID=UPI00145B2C3B
MASETVLERRRRVLGEHSLLFYDTPLHMVRGEDVWLYDADGKKYLDVYNNVPQVGHCHPRVVAALSQQAATLNVHTRYLNERVLDYAERLTSKFAPELSRAMFVCTGTEANELAIRIARRTTGKRGIIVTDCNYHGHSTILAELTTGIPQAEPFPDYGRTISIPDMLRSPLSEEELLRQHLAQVQEAIASLDAAGFGVAALLVDTLFSTEGLPVVPQGYLEAVVKLVREAGGLVIADEVQPGFARMGDAFWGHQHYAFTPDIVTMGKPIGNGHPMAALVTRPDIADPFCAQSMYFNTFGGNPVSAAVGLAVLDVIDDEGLLQNAHDLGSYIRKGLEYLQDRHELAAHVRGRGLFFGIELLRDGVAAAAETKTLINTMVNLGVLVSRIGPEGNVLKMRPPLTFRREHADTLIAALDRAFAEL